MARIAALDEDRVAAQRVLLQFGYHLVDAVKGGEGRMQLLEAFAYEPDLVETGAGKEIAEFEVLVMALGAEFAHLAEDNHLVGGVELAEVFERRMHAGGIGVVGVDDERVVVGLLELGAIVGGDVGGEGGVDGRGIQ